MKKAVLRRLRALSEEIIGEEETDKILHETAQKVVKEVLEETKPKKTKKKEEK